MIGLIALAGSPDGLGCPCAGGAPAVGDTALSGGVPKWAWITGGVLVTGALVWCLGSHYRANPRRR